MNKTNWLSLLPMLALAGLAACSGSKETTQQTRVDTLRTMSGLQYIDYVKGTGTVVEPGMSIKVDYAGYLTDGTLFDTSIDSVARAHGALGGGHQPIEFVVGAGKVIQGWDEGLTTDMRVGGRRRLIIPANLAYGARSVGKIPPNSTLVFDVHVIDARPAGVNAQPRR